MLQRRLTRRAFVLAALSSMTGLVAAQRAGSRAGAPVREPVAAENARIWIEPDLPPVFQSRADRLIALLCESHGTADIAPSPDHQAAALRLTTRPSKSAEAVHQPSEPLALVTSPRLPVRSLTVDQANAVLSGQITDWSELGAPTPVKVEIVQRPAGPDPAAWSPGLTVASYDDLVSLFPSRRIPAR